MWDQPAKAANQRLLRRIIPTYVGSTRSKEKLYSAGSNHSHVCGINDAVHKPHKNGNESFPRMWDQQTRSRVKRLSFRIIPTYVGSTMPQLIRSHSHPNHSHVCGINPTNSFYLASGNTASCSFVLLENGL